MSENLSRPGVWRYGKPLTQEENEILQEIGRNIRFQRLSKNMPLLEIAFRAGIARGTLYKMESGIPGVSMSNYIKVFSILDIANQMLEVGSRMLELMTTIIGIICTQCSKLHPLQKVAMCKIKSATATL